MVDLEHFSFEPFQPYNADRGARCFAASAATQFILAASERLQQPHKRRERVVHQIRTEGLTNQPSGDQVTYQ